MRFAGALPHDLQASRYLRGLQVVFPDTQQIQQAGVYLDAPLQWEQAGLIPTSGPASTPGQEAVLARFQVIDLASKCTAGKAILALSFYVLPIRLRLLDQRRPPITGEPVDFVE